MPKNETEGKRNNPYYQAQAILAGRDHAEHELRVKLARKGFDLQVIDEVIEKLKEQKLINDENFAKMFVANTLQFKVVGPHWLIHKLQEKGVLFEFIEPAVYEVLDNEKELELAQAAAEGWLKSHSKYKNDRQRLVRFLISRGFSSDTVMDVTADIPQEI